MLSAHISPEVVLRPPSLQPQMFVSCDCRPSPPSRLEAGFQPFIMRCRPPHLCPSYDWMQALTPLTIGRSRGTASALGALWGFGHSTGQLILGMMMVLLKVGVNNLAEDILGFFTSWFERPPTLLQATATALVRVTVPQLSRAATLEMIAAISQRFFLLSVL